MKYALGLYIVSNDQVLLDALEAKIPAKLDSKLWEKEYIVNRVTNEDGNGSLVVKVRFNLQADRTTALNWLASKAETEKIKTMSGSKVTKHKCYHDETPRQSCSEITVWSK